MSRSRTPNTNIYITTIATTSPLSKQQSDLPLLQAISNGSFSTPHHENKYSKSIHVCYVLDISY